MMRKLAAARASKLASFLVAGIPGGKYEGMPFKLAEALRRPGTKKTVVLGLQGLHRECCASNRTPHLH
jgi:hypothetical protein